MKNYYLVAIVATILFSGCKKDEEKSTGGVSNCAGASMSVTIDGNNSSSTEFNNTLLKENDSDPELGARRLDIRTQTPDGLLIISISNFNFQNPPKDGIVKKSYSFAPIGGSVTVCKETPSASYCDLALASLMDATGTTFKYVSGFVNFQEGILVITDVNTANKTISGYFENTVLASADITSEEEIIISGSFTNVCYRVVN